MERKQTRVRGTIVNQITTKIDFGFQSMTAEGRQVLGKLSRDVAAHNSRVREFQQDTEKLRAAAAENWTVKRDAEVGKLKERRASLLTAEIELREQIADWLCRVRDVETGAEVDAAIAEANAAETKVRNGLLSLGFIDDEHGRTIQMMVNYHPSVIAADMRQNNTHGKSLHVGPMNANTADLAKARQALDELKQAALAAVGV
jgi:hypothetical protein